MTAKNILHRRCGIIGFPSPAPYSLTLLSKSISKCLLTYIPPKFCTTRRRLNNKIPYAKRRTGGISPSNPRQAGNFFLAEKIKSKKTPEQDFTYIPSRSPAIQCTSKCIVHCLQFKKAPLAYTHLEKSVFTRGARRLMPTFESDPISCLCRPEGLQNCCTDINCLNVVSRVLCRSTDCPGREKCSNISFHMRAPPRMTPFLTNDGRGWGVRLEEPVREGEFVIELLGEIINEETLEKRLEKMKHEGNKSIYVIHLTSTLYIDCMFKGNLSRFINSSCEPNCETQKWIDGSTGQTHIGIFAIQDMEKGTELTYNYLPEGHYYGKGKINGFLHCRCGTKKCFMRSLELSR